MAEAVNYREAEAAAEFWRGISLPIVRNLRPAAPVSGVRLHRSPDGWWFELDGERFGVLYQGPGWGWSIYLHRSGAMVADGYHRLSELREDAERGVAEWRERT